MKSALFVAASITALFTGTSPSAALPISWLSGEIGQGAPDSSFFVRSISRRLQGDAIVLTKPTSPRSTEVDGRFYGVSLPAVNLAREINQLISSDLGYSGSAQLLPAPMNGASEPVDDLTISPGEGIDSLPAAVPGSEQTVVVPNGPYESDTIAFEIPLVPYQTVEATVPLPGSGHLFGVALLALAAIGYGVRRKVCAHT